MAKITFMGAGSTVFAKSVLGDCMMSPVLRDSHIALYDVDGGRLGESKLMLDTLNANVNEGRATISSHLGVRNRKAALRGADYVVNAIQVGGYKPCTVIDFEVPKKYGLRQTIADTLGIGGIFRALRTIPVVLDFARDMEDVCPGAQFLNYVNPMAMITGALLQGSGIRAVGLCHSVQGCAHHLLWELGLREGVKELQWKIAGINHQAWLLEISDGGRDLYPKIKRVAAEHIAAIRQKGGGRKVVERARKKLGDQWYTDPLALVAHDMVRLECMRHFGYYITESSEHNAEYMPYWIKSTHPELIDAFNIPLDEYPRRCVCQIADWKKRRDEIVASKTLTHTRSHEYGALIMEAMETDQPLRIGGNVMNTGLITNLPARACVEVACLVDRNGVQGCHVGDLPEVCAAVNRTNVNPQILTIDAALTRKRDLIYQAAMLDPHTAAELTLDEIRSLCDDLIAAHGTWLPKYR
jgi:alpha-galactosidase